MNALIIITEVVEKLILLGLLGLSIWSVSIMIDRRRLFKSLQAQERFAKMKDQLMVSQQKIDGSDFIAQACREWSSGKSPDQVDRKFSGFLKEHRQELEKGLPVLATLGSNAPFIGLFGTVLGIIRSFAYLGSQSGSTAVMSGVSQALYATALGLLVAIPAVVAFNIFSQNVRQIILRLEALRDFYVAEKWGK